MIFLKRYKKLEVRDQKSEVRSQTQFVNRESYFVNRISVLCAMSYVQCRLDVGHWTSDIGQTIHYSLFTILTSCLLLLSLSHYALAEEGFKESLSDLNKLMSPARNSELLWGKNPFIPPSEDKIRIGAKSTDLKGLRLSAIIYNEDNPSAIISQKIVYIGDTIEGQKVVDIKKNYVILQSNDKSYKLELKGIVADPETIEWGP